jgi:hypothetical protein
MGATAAISIAVNLEVTPAEAKHVIERGVRQNAPPLEAAMRRFEKDPTPRILLAVSLSFVGLLAACRLQPTD